MSDTTMQDWLSRLPASQGKKAQRTQAYGELVSVQSAESDKADELHEVLMVTYQRYWLD